MRTVALLSLLFLPATTVAQPNGRPPTRQKQIVHACLRAPLEVPYDRLLELRLQIQDLLRGRLEADVDRLMLRHRLGQVERQLDLLRERVPYQAPAPLPYVERGPPMPYERYERSPCPSCPPGYANPYPAPAAPRDRSPDYGLAPPPPGGYQQYSRANGRVLNRPPIVIEHRTPGPPPGDRSRFVPYR
jgi:hypothetical protein